MGGALLANLIWAIAFAADLAVKILALIFIPRNRRRVTAFRMVL
jgi:hypothetical protein